MFPRVPRNVSLTALGKAQWLCQIGIETSDTDFIGNAIAQRPA
jgi:hypothetical protein